MMRLNVNKWITKCGSVVEVSWDTTGMYNPVLVMKATGKEISVGIDTTGTKKFKLKGNTLKREISLKATDARAVERTVRRTIYTIGKDETDGFDSYTRITKGSMLWDKIKSYPSFAKRVWSNYPKRLKRLYLILVILVVLINFVGSELVKGIIIGAICFVLYSIIKKQ